MTHRKITGRGQASKMPAPRGGVIDLTQWLDTVQGHAITGWFSFGEWHRPAGSGGPNHHARPDSGASP
jgi:hypothetical protein